MSLLKIAAEAKNQQNQKIMPRTKKVSCDAILFDIDNVLIDTRHSYLEAIRWTIELYLTEGNIPLFSPVRNTELLISACDVHDFKLLGGFNDDWDCCYGLLVYLLSLPVKKRTMVDLKKALSVKKFISQIKQRPLGVEGITKIVERHPSVTIEKIGRIFQEIYLGRELFRAVEHKYSVHWKKRGLIEKERLIFKRRTLEKLVESGIRLGIATGRPRFEALFALKHFEIADLFDALTTMDDVKRAEREKKTPLRKPHPFSIIATAKRIPKAKSFLYVGDLPDDVLAANEAKETLDIRSVAFPTFSSETSATLKEIQNAQPDYLIRSPGELLKLLRI